MNHAAMNIAQTAIISAQNTRLQALEHSVQTGYATILARLDDTADRPRFPASIPSQHGHLCIATRSNSMVEHRRKRHARRFRVSLPSWLVSCTWEFGLRESECGWDFRIHAVNGKVSLTTWCDLAACQPLENCWNLRSFPYGTTFHGNKLGHRNPVPISSRFVFKAF